VGTQDESEKLVLMCAIECKYCFYYKPEQGTQTIHTHTIESSIRWWSTIDNAWSFTTCQIL